jgi:2-polyprenyl-3-methyl-5-hydroxy-6-metoxy-1,4-benzoquinol methylase
MNYDINKKYSNAITKKYAIKDLDTNINDFDKNNYIPLKNRIKLLSVTSSKIFYKLKNLLLQKFFNLLINSFDNVLKFQDKTNTLVIKIAERDNTDNYSNASFEQEFYASKSTKKIIEDKQAYFAKYYKVKDKVLDVGCGFGIFLNVLKKKGVDAIGLDIDTPSLEIAREEGLKVYRGRVPDCLHHWADGYFDGIVSFHVIEHMYNNDLLKFLSLAYKKIKTGGYFILETPNIEMLGILKQSFYRDITHIRPIHRETIEFLLRSIGFDIIEHHFSSPIREDFKLKLEKGNEIQNENISKLNDLLFGFQDCAVVARKSR